MEALTIPVVLFVHYQTNTFSQTKIIVATCDMSKAYPDQYVLLETREIRLEINQPDTFDLIALQVEQLRATKEQIVEDSHRQQARIDDKIQQLLCLDYSPINEDEIPY